MEEKFGKFHLAFGSENEFFFEMSSKKEAVKPFQILGCENNFWKSHHDRDSANRKNGEKQIELKLFQHFEEWGGGFLSEMYTHCFFENYGEERNI